MVKRTLEDNGSKSSDPLRSARPRTDQQALPTKSPRQSPSKSPKKLRTSALLEQDWLRTEPKITDLTFQQFEVIDQQDVMKIFGITEEGNSVLVNCNLY